MRHLHPTLFDSFTIPIPTWLFSEEDIVEMKISNKSTSNKAADYNFCMANLEIYQFDEVLLNFL